LFQKANLHLVNFGLDLEQFRQQNTQDAAKRKFGIPEKNLVISFRGSSDIYKGLDYIKECLRQLSTRQPITLMVFQEKGLVAEFAERFQIVEPGWIDDDAAMVDAYEASDIFLMPSIAESFGMMGIEAMACGKPVIAMEGTALAEVLRAEESGCMVVPQGNVNAMRTCLEQLLADENLRRQIGACSRMVAEKYYNKDRYIDELLAVYEQAIERKRGDTRARYLVEQQKKVPLPKPEFALIRAKIVEVEKITLVPDLTEKEYRFLTLLRRVRGVPFIHFAYVNVAKPVLRFARKVWQSLG
jgi:glycosyltransferase involved in cell wall biosynthesis